MLNGTMDPKYDYSKMNTKKKPSLKSDYQLVNEDIESSSNRSDLVEYPIKMKENPRERRPQVKKVVTLKDTPLIGLRMKNPSTSLPHSPSSSEDDEDSQNKELEDDAIAVEIAKSSS